MPVPLSQRITGRPLFEKDKYDGPQPTKGKESQFCALPIIVYRMGKEVHELKYRKRANWEIINLLSGSSELSNFEFISDGKKEYYASFYSNKSFYQL